MNERSRVGGKLIGELVVVFLGVLIALGADAWWEGREARMRLHDNLAVLAEDMVAVREDLTRALARDSTSIALAVELQSAIAEREADLAARNFARWCEDFLIPVLSVRTGTLEYLVSSGDLRWADDPEVQAELVDALSRIKLLQGFNNDLGTDARRSSEGLFRVGAEARIAGAEPSSYLLGSVDALSGLMTIEFRLSNIATLIGNMIALTERVEAAARKVVEGS